MKKTIYKMLCCAMIIAVGASSCQKTEEAKEKAATSTTKTKRNDLPNYRYVDVDTILKKYNLSIDYNDEMVKRQDAYASEARRHENSIKSMMSQMEHKYKNNQYDEQSFNADQAKLQQMQTSAQSSLENLQMDGAKAEMEASKAVMDSIQAFIKDYNAKHHYDAILIKAATLYIDPALDITDEVVAGLNARYNKKAKK